MTRATPTQDSFPGCMFMLLVMIALAIGGCKVALGGIPHETIVRERFDEIQVHQFYNEDNGHLVFSQFLFRNFQPDGSLQIEAWRMAKGDGGDRETICLPSGEVITVWHELPKSLATPRWNHNRECWELLFHDGDLWRCVESRTLSESGLWYDPEVTERDLFGKELRRELRAGITK